MHYSAGDEAVFDRKLKAGKFFTWSLTLEQNKGILVLSDDLREFLGYVGPSQPLDWTFFVETYIHPEARAAMFQAVRDASRDLDCSIFLECRVWSQRTKNWWWMSPFGNADEIDISREYARLSGGLQDIQDRMEAMRLREQEHSLNASLIDSLPGSYLLSDMSGVILRWNPNFEQTFTLPEGGPSRAQWTEIFSPEERPVAAKALETSTDGATHSFRAHAVRRDGSRGWFFCQCRPLEVGGSRRMLVLLFDVTDSETAQIQLQHERSRLDTIISAANLGTWDWNITTDEVIYNKAWADIVGVRLEDIQGSVKSWEHAVLPEDLPRAMEAVEAHCRGETAMYEAEFRMQRGDGAVIWGIDRGRVVEWDENGKAIRLMGVLQEITKSKEAAIELVRSKNQLELVVRETGLGTWDWNPVTNEILFNDTFFSMLGYGHGDIDTSFDGWIKLIHPDDLANADSALENLLSGETTEYECELRMRHKDGHYVWTYDLGHAVERDKDGRIVRVVGGHFDIDKRKQEEQEQREALETIAHQKQELERAVEERTVLLREAQQRIDGILAITGQLPDSASDLLPLADAAPLRADADESFSTLADSFSHRLGNAFDLITEKMWWYKALIDSLPFPIFVTDMDSRWTYLNAPALETIGASSVNDVIGSRSRPWGVDQSSYTVSGDPGKEDSVIINRYHPELERFFQGQISHLYDQSGRHIGHIEAMQDVTKVHEADERTRIMLDALPLACNFWDPNFNNIDCNQAAAKLFGLSSKQEYLDRFFELSPEFQPGGRPTKDLAYENIVTAFRDGYCRFEWMHQYPDGTPVPAEITLVRVEYGKDYIVVGYTRDLRELKAKEAELDRERQLLLKIMDSSPVCFVILVDEVIRFATPHAMEFFGVGIGGDIADFYIDAEERTAFLSELRSTGMINWRVVNVRAADGSIKDMLANAFLAEYFGEPCVMSWFLDITDMRETQRQLGIARDAAEENARAKSDFLANMSHEIRTPMNAILGMIRLALDTALTPQQHGYLEKTEQSAKALLRILNDILDFSKIEAGKLEMEITEFPLAQVMRGVVDMFRESASARGLRLALAVDEEAPPVLRGDPLRLQQILINLVGNAVKFTERGEVFMQATLLEQSATSTTLRFSVRDTGIGLAPEQQEKLFSAFSQADTSTTRRYGGTGLGLAISKRLVEMMHGEIACTSQVGRGAEFTFSAVFELASPEALSQGARLQEQQDEAMPEQSGARGPESLVAHLAGRRILVAEDNEINQIVAREMLEKAGFAVEIASNGREAVAMALAGQYDLIFMDIQMPGMDGLSATTELRRHPQLRDMPIIAMTAHAMVGDKEKSLAVGMNDHITKPIDGYEIFNVIAKWISQPARQSEPDRSEAGRADVSVPSRAQEPIVTELPSSLPGIDVAAALPRVAGNKKLYVKLLRQVAADAPNTREKLSTAIMSGDAQAVRDVAHSLKGASANLAITDVTAAAERLESAAKAEDFPALITHLDALEQALQQYVSVVGTLEGL